MTAEEPNGSNERHTAQPKPSKPLDSPEQFADDDSALRTLTTVIHRIRNSANQNNKPATPTHNVPSDTIKTLSKFAFLLVRDKELVAASPCGTHGIAVVAHMAAEEDLEDPVGAQEREADALRVTASTRCPEFTIFGCTLDDILIKYWNLSWEEHVQFFIHLLNGYLRVLWMRNPTAIGELQSAIITYAIMTGAAKFARRLIESKATETVTFYELVQDHCIRRYIRKRKSLLGIRPPYGKELRMSSLFNQRDREFLLCFAVDIVGQDGLPNIQRSQESPQYNFFELLDERHYKKQELDEKLLMSVLYAFWDLITQLLVASREATEELNRDYPVGKGYTPTMEALTPLRTKITYVHMLMNHLIFRSDILRWLIANIISTPLSKVFASSLNTDWYMKAERVDIIENQFHDLTDTNPFTDEHLQRFWSWLQHTYCESRYISAVYKELRQRKSVEIVLQLVSTRPSRGGLNGWEALLKQLYPDDPDVMSSPAMSGSFSSQQRGCTWDHPQHDCSKRLWSPMETLRQQATEETASVSGYTWLNFLDGSDVKRSAHPETILATLLLLQRTRELGELLLSEQDWKIIDSLGPLNVTIGPSSPCCAVCNHIINAISRELRTTRNGNWVSYQADMEDVPVSLYEHTLITPCSFPPFLPRMIRRKVLDFLEDELRDEIEKLRTRLQGRRWFFFCDVDEGDEADSDASDELENKLKRMAYDFAGSRKPIGLDSDEEEDT
ncbi:hypothetical protein BJ508DRAFT_310799 [Ascobolus immersus RN42]|uniref:Uncharacterized protein n=1 Tax=Ascobolus immersus RN42 TaxID=1160509 RepID=A0A3N4I4J7_ASCIM|nr:hypothetical protein BJ508DRAFT_310799 [Ascobolus immersus RN42]